MTSIITPSFNSEHFIEETYQSIIAQTNPNWEWVIVDDGSTDNTLQLLEKYSASDNRIHFYKRDRLPKGATTCRNIAVEKCKGDSLIFLDTDDVLASFCIEQRQTMLYQNKGCDFIYFQMLIFNKKLDDTKLIWNIADERNDLERAIKLNPIMAGSSTIWDKESFIKIGMWDDKILINQDIELHIRAFCKNLHYLNSLHLPPDIFVRNNQQSISRAKKKSTEKQLSRVYYFEQIYGHLHRSNNLQTNLPHLQWLYVKLFFDLLYDQEPVVAKKLFQFAAAQHLLLTKKVHMLCALLLFLGTKAKMVIELLRFINRKILFKNSNNNQTFGKLVYTEPIRY
jgi:glycosyltransferase involved in cell wall biosynthesis